jgi:hypothetical protein
MFIPMEEIDKYASLLCEKFPNLTKITIIHNYSKERKKISEDGYCFDT